MMVNIGYTFIGEGYATLTVYEGGLFGSTTDDIVNLASVRILEDGRFDRASLKTASSHTGGTHSSTMVVHEGLGYVFCNDAFQVYDVSTMELLASASEGTFYAHGDMAISTGHPGKVYAYRASYNNTSQIAVAVYDVDSNTISVEFLSDVSVQQYCSQQPRFLSDGSIVFVNDKGLLYCVKAEADATGMSMDIQSVEMGTGEEIRLGVAFNPSNSNGKGVTWSTSDPSVAVVSEDGIVTAVGPGRAVVTAVSDVWGFSAECAVHVVGMSAGSRFVQDGVVYKVVDPVGRTVSAVGYEDIPDDLVIPAGVVAEGLSFEVTGIGLKAFARSGIKTLVTYVDVGQYAFYGCLDLRSVTVMDGAASIQKSAFSECRRLAAVELPGTLTVIGENAFYNCVALSSISFPDSLESIGMKAFAYCKKLTSLTIPSDVGAYAFYKCTGLKTLRIEGESATVAKSAFSGCTGLRNVYVSDGIGSIVSNAFYGCSFYVLGKKVGVTAANLAGHKFLGTCDHLEAYVPDIGGSFSIDGVRYSVTTVDGKTEVAVKGASVKDVVIPGSVRYLGFDWKVTEVMSKAFYGNGSIESVEISGPTSVGTKAFAECKNLASVRVVGKASIGSYAFANCSGLSVLDLSAVKKIGASAFSGCVGLSEAAFSEALSSVGSNAFYKVKFYEGGEVLPNTVAGLVGKSFQGSGGILYAV
ncbi:MAG: leucine-rich repeat protein, partial [Candidatus Methanomethylophilaceae archaeon]|nr:leucine-rich repeat protein [Candidatus Methanomethylophilaceae archaeon]